MEIEDFGSEIEMRGEIGCIGGIIISVNKTIRYVQDDLVQTSNYSYNVRKLNGHNWFRYDNGHVHEGHLDEHHKDVFNPETGERFPSEWVGKERWPHLSLSLIHI